MNKKSIILTITVAGALFVGAIVCNIFDTGIAAPPGENKNNLQIRTGETECTAEQFAILAEQAEDESKPVDNNPAEGDPEKDSEPAPDPEEMYDQIRRAGKPGPAAPEICT